LAALAVVRDLREHWAPASAEELEQFETDALSGFVLARASAGLADGTIRGDVGHLDQIRTWFGRPLWDMEPADADAYFGKVLRGSPSGTRLARSQALSTYFMFLELRHKVELHRMTGRVIECPIDDEQATRREGRPAADSTERAGGRSALHRLGRRAGHLPQVRPYRQELHRLEAAVPGRPASERGMRARPGRHQVGPGTLRKAPRPPRQGRPRLGPSRTDGPADQRRRPDPSVVHRRRLGPVRRRPHPPRRPLFPSERKNADGSSRRVGDDALRNGLKDAAKAHLPGWGKKLTPHVLRHFCASQLYGNGLDLLAIREVLGHSWIATTMRYIHVQQTRVEDAWVAGMERAAKRLEGLAR
jgi:hypothetical protein